MFLEILIELILRKNLVSKIFRVVKGFFLYFFVVMGVIGGLGSGVFDIMFIVIIFFFFFVISLVIIFLGFLNFLFVISNILLYVG